MPRIRRLYDKDQKVIFLALQPSMARIRRLYDKDQEVIIYNSFIVTFQIFLLDWLESGNLEISNFHLSCHIDKFGHPLFT